MTAADDLVRRHIAAFNAHDAERLLADFHPGATWVTGDYTVPSDELQEFFEGAMRAITPTLTLARVVDGEGVVVAEMTESWTHENESRSASLVAIFDLVDGRISRAKIYREGSADA